MSLIDKINRMQEIGEFAARLRASPFTLVDEVDYEPDAAGNAGTPARSPSRQPTVAGRSARVTLSPDDIAHLTFAHRHGMPVHQMEVAALLDCFYKAGDTETLRRSIAILEHLLELSTP